MNNTDFTLRLCRQPCPNGVTFAYIVTVLERGHGSVLIHAQKRLEYLLARGKTSPASQFFKE